jgi:DNA adenine methylase
MMPIHSDLLNYWEENEETEPIKKALRFLMLSNMRLFGKKGSLRYGERNNKYGVQENIDRLFNFIEGVQFNNKHFKPFLKSFSIDKEKAFIYNDPPYLGTTDNYSHSFKEQDSLDLFNTLEKTGCKWAMSEFDHPFILKQAKERNLNVIEIGERQNLKNRRTEILVTNYKTNQLNLFS